MSLHPDVTYNGTVEGGVWTRSSTGNLGFKIALQCKDGAAEFTFYLSGKDKEKAKKKAAQNFHTLGITDEQMRSATFLNHQLSAAIQGREVSFGTVSDDYNGKVRVKVLWIGPKQADPGELAEEAANFFGGNGASSEKKPFEATDEDVPF